MRFPEYHLISHEQEQRTALPRSQYPFQMTFDVERVTERGYAFMKEWRPLLRAVLEMPPQHELNMYFQYFATEWIKAIDLPVAYARAVTLPPNVNTPYALRETPGMREWVDRPRDYKQAMDHYRPRIEAAMGSMSIGQFILYCVGYASEGRRSTADNVVQLVWIYGREIVAIAHQLDCVPMYQSDTVNLLINQATSEIQIIGGVLHQTSIMDSRHSVLFRTDGLFDSLVHDMEMGAPRLYDWRSRHSPY